MRSVPCNRLICSEILKQGCSKTSNPVCVNYCESTRCVARPLNTHTAGTYIALCDIRTCYGIPALAGPVRMEELAAGLVGALVGVGAEVVALSLQQIGGQA